MTRSRIATFAVPLFLGLIAAIPSFSQTPPASAPALYIADTHGNSVTVSSLGAVCSGTACSTLASGTSIGAGKIVWSGTIGDFTILGATGETKPVLLAPTIDTALVSVTSGATGGTLTLIWGDTGFNESGGPVTMLIGTTVTQGSATAVYNSYFDSSNTLWGTNTFVGTITGTGAPADPTYFIGNGPATFPFAMTLTETISMAANTKFSNDDGLNGTPGLSVGCSTPNGFVNAPYSSTIPASGGTPPYKFSITSGSLPLGLSLDTNTGLISGSPTFASTYSFTVQVTDSLNNTATHACQIIIVLAGQQGLPPTLSCPSPTGTEGQPYDSSLVAQNGQPPYAYTIIGGLPPGLNLLGTGSGEISGTPNSPGFYTFTATVTDSETPSGSASKSCSISIGGSGFSLKRGEAATIGFWHNRNGQALIDAMNGGSSSTSLGSWLGSNFGSLFGSLAGQSNSTVAATFQTYFGVKGAKTVAQVMAGALACYVTNPTLAGGNFASSYGFLLSTGGGFGTCGDLYNVGTYGTAIGLLNNKSYSVLQLLQAANALATPSWSSAVSNALNSIFSGINQTGDIQ